MQLLLVFLLFFTGQVVHGARVGGGIPRGRKESPEELADKQKCLKKVNGKFWVGQTVNKQVLRSVKIDIGGKKSYEVQIPNNELRHNTGMRVSRINLKAGAPIRYLIQCTTDHRAREFRLFSDEPVTGQLEVEYYGSKPTPKPRETQIPKPKPPAKPTKPSAKPGKASVEPAKPAAASTSNQGKMCFEITDKEARIGQTRGLKKLQTKEVRGTGSVDLTYQLTPEEERKYTGIRVDLSHYNISGDWFTRVGGGCSADDEKRAKYFRLLDSEVINTPFKIEFYGKA